MGHRSACFVAAIFTAALATQLSALPASAESQPDQRPTITFTSTDASSFADIQASMLYNNDPEDVAAFLNHVAASDNYDLEPLKLDEFSAADAASLLAKAAELSEAGTPMTDEISPRVGPGSFYTIAGQAINADRSWEFTRKVETTDCGWLPWEGCELRASIDFRFRTDPNDMNTATIWTANKFGDNTLSGFTLSSMVYQDGYNYFSSNEETYWNPGYGTQWNFNPVSNNGQTFQAGYQVKITRTDTQETIWFDWATGVTQPCAEPIPGAFGCIFP